MYKSEHSDQNYVGSCNLASAIVYYYQSLCLVQKLDKMYRPKKPEKIGTISINWFQTVFKITGCANCFENNLRLLPITGFSDDLVKPVPNPNCVLDSSHGGG